LRFGVVRLVVRWSCYTDQIGLVDGWTTATHRFEWTVCAVQCRWRGGGDNQHRPGARWRPVVTYFRHSGCIRVNGWRCPGGRWQQNGGSWWRRGGSAGGAGTGPHTRGLWCCVEWRVFLRWRKRMAAATISSRTIWRRHGARWKRVGGDGVMLTGRSTSDAKMEAVGGGGGELA
jgi:hypothetical protein